jgi:peroxiredoxin
MTDNRANELPTGTAPVDAVEQLVRSLRHSRLPLDEKLAQLTATIAATEPQYAAAYDRLVARLEHANVGASAPQTGDAMPAFVLPDEHGHFVSLDKLVQDGPVIVAFLRGHWCPYCRINAIALAEIAADIAPARIIAISPDTAGYAKRLRNDSAVQFPILTDVGNGYALSLGLAFAVGEELEAMLEADACALPVYQASLGSFLPIPAIFVVGRDGIIRDRHVNPDFRQRMTIDALLRTVRSASAGDS